MSAKTAPKMRPDVSDDARRAMLEAAGQEPSTLPPSELGGTDKHSEAVRHELVYGKKGGTMRAESLSEESKAEVARVAASARLRRRV